MYVILLKRDTKNAHPSAKKAKNGLFQLSTHPRTENDKNTFFAKILSFFENLRKNRYLGRILKKNFFFLFFTKKEATLGTEL